MPQPASGQARRPLVWRVPPWQPALLLLVACGCAAVNLYAHPPVLVRVPTLVIGAAAIVSAVVALRMYLVVDDEGIGVCRLLRERSVNWADVESVSVIERGMDTMTLRITRRDGAVVDVPQALVLPTRPTGKARVRAQLADVARQVTAYGEPYRR